MPSALKVSVITLGAIGGTLLGLSPSLSLHTFPPHVDGRTRTLVLFENGRLEDGTSVLVPSTACRDLSGWAAGQLGMSNCSQCTLYDQSAGRITQCDQLQPNQSVWVVPPERWFVFPTGELGRTVELRRMRSPRKEGHAITLETLSQSPRVFRLNNFLTDEESDELVANALADTDPVTSLQRSTTGAEHQVSFNKVRTSENAFDGSSRLARILKERAVDVLGMLPYDEEITDGLQVLRYNVSTAYISHHDYLDDNGGGHDYDSSKDGSNRFATVLFYLSDVEEGGETLFPQGQAVDEGEPNAFGSVTVRDVPPEDHIKAELIANGTMDLFEPGRWERRMLIQCKTRLAVKPKKATAVLFYSQHPDGTLDKASLHGACPVIRGTKWAANLWIWNKVRLGYQRAPRKKGAGRFDSSKGVGRDRLVKGKGGDEAPKEPPVGQPKASFFNKDVIGASLFYEDTFWDDFPPGKSIGVNTFKGHGWNVRVQEKNVLRWVITEELDQKYILSQANL
eukprot:CAMPEP_0118962014 /NCGR_PEP_ID=MMETSP1173-20130426/499_1 /TAXON_ID=1034831 /ORGANISM="Rhizochromulina marina cf, Strain CCMP1243" /LENGTH=508 /DNA_ID=CAMNT_0006910229 /DNA_START=69 /DNA_END=1595 /DNA_ORIENTATION=+